MLFNSITFLFFATIFFIGFKFIRRVSNNWYWLFLTIASFFFYGWWDWKYLFLLIFTGLIDFAAAIALERWKRHRWILLMMSMTVNLVTLGIFKYAFFFGMIAGKVVDVFGLTFKCCQLHPFFLTLPIGISFYTFQSMSYTIDVYRRQLKPTYNILHFFAFLSLFPQLVAGPIVRAANLLPQLCRRYPVGEMMRWNGCKLIALGYFKKTVLADNIGPFVNNAFANELDNPSTTYWWIVMIGFTLQIYFDFSGYSDIARGLAKWMGIHFRVNFNHPYLSQSFREFWNRWHISLSTWFRDYVYIPLGGSRVGKIKGIINLWITMLLSGLWHGAGFNFIIWGALHAFYLTLERAMAPLLQWLPFRRILAIPFVFILIVITWVFFRAADFNQAQTVIHRLFSFDSFIRFGNLDVFNQALIFIVLAIIIELFVLFLGPMFRRNRRSAWHRPVDIAATSILLLGAIFLRGTAAQFVYFQF